MSVVTLDGDASGVGMCVVGERCLLEDVVEPLALRDLERIAEALVVRTEAHQAAGDRLVGAVPLTRAGERAVQLDACPLWGASDEISRQESQSARARRVRRRRADHDRADDVEERDHGYPALRRRAGCSSMVRKYFPVCDASTRATSSGVPVATIVPPRVPPSGPRSTTQSPLLMTSRLFSMSSTVLPRSTSRCSTWSSTRTSSKWRPVVGSSRM